MNELKKDVVHIDKHMILPICEILKKHELIGRTERDSQTLKNLWLPKGTVERWER